MSAPMPVPLTPAQIIHFPGLVISCPSYFTMHTFLEQLTEESDKARFVITLFINAPQAWLYDPRTWRNFIDAYT